MKEVTKSATTPIWRNALAKPAHRRAGQGGDAGYCFDETSEQ
jgi:hypothetical protein